ncbi:hypothetical protein Ahy_B10g105742 [Arachis hypogaea]|uniref:Aminotransferase-like plant mobile domain-containing protein n=1 Tax=Arachis hypogaea TaxID=3818 RepID=A0A444X8T9_ARAHY|nr:hypothetical protein Ahy_B10g105742 [Arachis hypogaea]
MARQAGNDRNINRLNETSHYAGAADFERPRLLLPRRVSQTFPPLDAIVPYLAKTGFGDTVPLKDFTFDNFLISALVERWRPETHTWYGTETWAMVEQRLSVRPPMVAQQAAQRKESFTLKLVWLRDRVCQMPPTDDPETLRQYARCYIMLLIGGNLLTDKSNNLVHVRWLPLLRDFAECRGLSWGSAVLAWTYQSLCLAAQRGVTDIAGCTPLLMSWIYQRFSQLVGLQQQSRDQHQGRVLYWRVSIDRLRFDEFAWMVYDDPALQALCPHWFREEEEWGTWLSAVPLVCFNIVRYLTTTDRGEDVWWPERLQQWYDGWRQRFDPGRRITVHHTFDTRPTGEYYDWWRGACRVRHLSGQNILEDPRLVELPPDVQPTASQPRDDLTLPRGVPDRRRRAREVIEDTCRPARRKRGQRERRPGEPVRRERARPRRARGDTDSEEEAEFDRQEDQGDWAAVSASLGYITTRLV